jgi:phage shock protein E
MKKLIFIISFGISLTAMSCSSNTEEVATKIEQEKEVVSKNITVTEFAKLLNSVPGQVLDVRTPEEWKEGTIKDAQTMNFFDKDFSLQIDQLDKKQPVLVYCKSGGRSGKAAKQLEKKGFTVYNLIGGITAWKAAGKTISKKND